MFLGHTVGQGEVAPGSGIKSGCRFLFLRNKKFVWSEDCQNAFEKIKSLLLSAPVLKAPDFEKPFKLQADASNIGIGAVLLQEGHYGIDHPVCYVSFKFKEIINKNQRLLCWSLAFQEYNFRMHHIKGCDNILADALSRAII